MILNNDEVVCFDKFYVLKDSKFLDELSDLFNVRWSSEPISKI